MTRGTRLYEINQSSTSISFHSPCAFFFFLKKVPFFFFKLSFSAENKDIPNVTYYEKMTILHEITIT